MEDCHSQNKILNFSAVGGFAAENAEINSSFLAISESDSIAGCIAVGATARGGYVGHRND